MAVVDRQPDHDRPTNSRPLLRIIETVVHDLSEQRRWRINPVGSLDLLPEHTAAVLKEARRDQCRIDGLWVNVAVGYGGRQEIADAVRSLLAEHAERGTSLDELVRSLDVEHISEHLYTKGQPDPDLVIRTSGEQRLSGFMLWQSAHSEYYFCEAYWPDFRRVDFLRALRSYAQRHRTIRQLASSPADQSCAATGPFASLQRAESIGTRRGEPDEPTPDVPSHRRVGAGSAQLRRPSNCGAPVFCS